MTIIVLESPNPYDPTLEDLQPFGEALELAIREAGASDVSVELDADQVHGAGTTLWHVVYVWLPDLKDHKDAIWLAVGGAGVKYLKQWRAKRPEERQRPGQVTILGPDGQPVSVVEVPAGDDLPIIRLPMSTDRRRDKRFLPSRRRPPK